ncbi:MAG TPA: hypothetical protein VNJ46_10645 [Gaiellaceae bacterium]|nr:hypothetical protein [Gaiellaceae bacterium]
MRAGASLGLALMAVGGAIVALPDADDRLFSLSEKHGPAPADALGTAVLLAGYAILATLVWRRRRRLPRRGLRAALALVCAGVALLAPAVAFDLGPLWALAAAAMAAPQAYLLATALHGGGARAARK